MRIAVFFSAVIGVAYIIFGCKVQNPPKDFAPVMVRAGIRGGQDRVSHGSTRAASLVRVRSRGRSVHGWERAQHGRDAGKRWKAATQQAAKWVA